MSNGDLKKGILTRIWGGRKTKSSTVVEPVSLVEPNFDEAELMAAPAPHITTVIIEEEILSTPPAVQLSDAQEEPTIASTKKSGFWKSKLSAAKSSTEGDDDVLDEEDLERRRPIRLLIGFIPDVTEKDAKFFVAGVAEKNVDSAYIGYMGIFKYSTGYAYEIQEGGHGRSYLDPIIQYYKDLPYGQSDRETAVFIKTAQRMVQVEKAGDGAIVCIQLPESSVAAESNWLKPTKKLKLLRDLNTGYMVASGAFLALTFIGLVASYASRYQPIETPPIPTQDKVNVSELPSQQWYRVASPGDGHYIRAWKYNGKWQNPEIGTFEIPAPPTGKGKHKADGESIPLPPVPISDSPVNQPLQR